MNLIYRAVRFFLIPIKHQQTFFIFSSLCLAFPPIYSAIRYFGDIGMARGIITAICGSMSISYFGTILINLCNYKWLKLLVKSILYFIIILMSYIAAILRLKFGRFITPSELSIFLDTNIEESINFFNAYLDYNIAIASVIIMITIVTMIIYLEKRQAHHPYNFVRKNLISYCLFICLIYGTYDLIHILRICTFDKIEELESWTGNQYWRIDDRYGDPITKLLYSNICINLSSHKVKDWHIYNEKAYTSKNTTHSADDLKIVMIIGESFIKWHSQLYGYPRKTNPNLFNEQSKGNLVAYNDVVCSDNSTIEMMRNIMCTNDLSNREDWNTTPFFPLLFASAGWKIYYWDNQTQRKGDTWIYNFTMSSFLFDKYLIEKCYTSLYENTYSFDGESVDDFACNISIGTKNELSIFHLIGQHFNATSRYPHTPDFNVFTSDEEISADKPWLNEAKRHHIAEYDNATLYNDFVINKILNLYRDKNAIVIYFSDHGEEMYDYRDSQGRAGNNGDTKNYLKYQYNIPFFIWMSDTFIKNNDELASKIRMKTNVPFMSNNISHMIMGIAQMDSPYYRKELNPLDTSYIVKERVVCNGRINYDEIMQSHKVKSFGGR